MTEHAWAQEQIASYLTGGLAAEERERLDRHAKDCPECAEGLMAAVHFDRGLGTLFAPMRPKPGLEDRAVRATRVAPKRHAILILGWPRRITAVAAVLVGVITFGALAAAIIGNGDLPLPGEGRRLALTTASASPEVGGAPDLTNEDTGLHSNLEAGVDLERLSQKTINDIIVNDPIGVPNAKEENTAALKLAGTIRNGSIDATDLQTNLAGLTEEARKLRARGAETRERFAQPGNNFNTNGYLQGQGNLGGIGGGGFSGNGWTANNSAYPNAQLFSYYSGNYAGENRPAFSNAVAPPTVPVLSNAIAPPTVPVNPASGPVPTAKPTDLYFVPNDKLARSFPDTKFNELTKGDDKRKDDVLNPTAKVPEPTIQPPGTSTPAKPPEPPAVVPEPTRRIVLRSGDIEFEIESFDSGLATVTQLVTKIKGAFIGTVNSEKLANGKVRGSITVRTPPESLDGLVLDLRRELGKGGELKSVKLASQDVTKQYTDTESRLRASRAMETRLLQIIKDGKGEIKQLLEAERELGLWRTKIEEAEGELRYFANLAALSSLTITLQEKEIRVAAGVNENERVQAGVEVEDVDKTYQQVLKEILDAKGRVLKSELKQLSAGQFNAMLNFEVSPEASGPIRDRLRQLGRVARLEIDRQQQAEGGTMPKNAPVKRGDTLFIVQLYNLANVAPRETATLAVAVADVPAAYNTIRDAIAKAAARVQVAQLNETDKNNVTAQLNFDIKRTDEPAIRAALQAAGDIASRSVSRAAESDQVTDTKILYNVTLSSVARIRPRDTLTLQVAVNDVSTSYATLRDAITSAKGRILASNLDENDKQNVNANLDFEVRRTEEAAVKGSLESAGELLARTIAHAPENELATDTKVLYSVRLLPANRLRPRETTVLGLEVTDVDNAVAVFGSQFNEVKGRQIDSKSGRERNGKATARLVYEVPLATAGGLVERFKGAGLVRALNTSRDTTAPEGKSATARIEITMASPDAIVETEDGLWSPVKKGLTYSASFLLRSMTWVVFVLCAVLPWALLGYGGYKLARRATRSTPKIPEPRDAGSQS